MRLTSIAILRHRGYRSLLVGQVARGYAQWTVLTVVPVVVLRFGGGPSVVGLIWFMQMAPIFFLAPVGGILADRRQKSSLLMVLHAGLALAGLALVAVVIDGNERLPLLLLATGAFGLLTAIEMPVRQSLVSDLVDDAELASAIAFHQAAFNATRIAAPAIAMIVVVSFGPEFSLAAGAAASLIAGLCMLNTRSARPGRVAGGRPSTWAMMRSGFAASRESPIVVVMLKLLALTASFAMAFQAVLVVHLSDSLHLSPTAYGYVLSALGVGTLLGASTIAMTGSSRTWLVWASAAGVCAAVVALAFVRSVGVVTVTAVFAGYAYGILVAVSNTLIQSSVPENVRGRVVSHYLAVLNGGLALGSVSYGLLSDHLGTSVTMVLGGTIGLVGIAALRAMEPVRREARETSPA